MGIKQLGGNDENRRNKIWQDLDCRVFQDKLVLPREIKTKMDKRRGNKSISKKIQSYKTKMGGLHVKDGN